MKKFLISFKKKKVLEEARDGRLRSSKDCDVLDGNAENCRSVINGTESRDSSTPQSPVIPGPHLPSEEKPTLTDAEESSWDSTDSGEDGPCNDKKTKNEENKRKTPNDDIQKKLEQKIQSLEIKEEELETEKQALTRQNICLQEELNVLGRRYNDFRQFIPSISLCSNIVPEPEDEQHQKELSLLRGRLEELEQFQEQSRNAKVFLKVAGKDLSLVGIRIPRQSPLRKLMRAYCEIKRFSMKKTRFRFNGQPINETDTPAQLEMEDDDTIEVFRQQTRGVN